MSKSTYPGADLALVVVHDGGDVVLNDLGESGLVGDAVDPGSQLGVPDQSVAADGDAGLLGEVGEEVSASKVELALVGLEGIPLHAVLGGDLAEVGLDDRGGLAAAEGALVGSSADIQLALGLEKLVDACSGLAAVDAARGSGQRSQRGEEKETSLHFDD